MVLSQFTPIAGKVTLSDLDLGLEKDVYPVGRLDEDSEGLLLLTNDKTLNIRLLDPKNMHPRTYLVQVDGNISEEAIHKLQQGVTISLKEGKYKTLPCFATKIIEPLFLPLRHPPIRFRANIPTSWLKLTLIEGKNRQVRKMTAAVGFPTLRLVRYALGDYTIDDFKSGELKEINKNDLLNNITI